MALNWQAVSSQIRSALMRRGRSRQDADDLVQEAYLRLACAERLQAVAKPEAFLMRAALNLSLDAHRTTRNHGEQVLLEDAVLIDASPSAEDTVLARERMGRLSLCLAELDPRSLKIFLAHRIEGMTYAEIARANRLGISAVEKHIAKAALMLTRSMEGWWP
ncbi:MAG: sigma-70 family RNA polymerase sigma factor [Paucibacter sp.]|nr:sigma-70 family RNA polymerase sigma factor [Roseateles sp.]